MKKYLALILVALMVVPFGMMATTSISAAGNTDLYVKDGGTGDGSSADNALPSLDAANQAAAALTTDVTIKFVGAVNLNADMFTHTGNTYQAPAHSNKITWTAADANSKLVVNTTDTAALYYELGGELTVKNLAIENTGKKVFVLVTLLHNLTIDTGVSVTNVNGAAPIETISIYGAAAITNYNAYERMVGWNAETKTHTANTTITVKSGNFKQVVGYVGNYSNKHPGVNLNGKVTINISGANTYVGAVHPVVNSYNYVKDCEITFDGGIIGNYVGAVDRKYTAGIVTYGAAGVVGEYVVYLTKNFDLSAQTYLDGKDGMGNSGKKTEFYNGICGATCNDDYVGSPAAENLGNYILKADAEIYDAVAAETVKINKDSFDKIEKVEAAQPEQPEQPDQPGDTPSTGDMTWVVAVVAAVAVMGSAVVLKKREN